MDHLADIGVHFHAVFDEAAGVQHGTVIAPPKSFPDGIERAFGHMARKIHCHLADMTSKRRPENIAFPRQVAMYLSRQMTESSLNTIGEAFGGRDHGTVLHACRLVKDRMEVDANVRQVVHYLEKQLMR